MFYAFTLVLILALFFAVKLIKNLTKSTWKTAQGKVQNITIEKRFHSTAHRTGRTNAYEVLVNYIYDIEGNIYNGSNFFYNISAEFDSQQEAEGFAGGYSEGMEVEVYYLDSNPGESCLIHYKFNAKQQNVIYALMFLCAIIIEFFIYKLFWR